MYDQTPNLDYHKARGWDERRSLYRLYIRRQGELYNSAKINRSERVEKGTFEMEC